MVLVHNNEWHQEERQVLQQSNRSLIPELWDPHELVWNSSQSRAWYEITVVDILIMKMQVSCLPKQTAAFGAQSEKRWQQLDGKQTGCASCINWKFITFPDWPADVQIKGLARQELHRMRGNFNCSFKIDLQRQTSRCRAKQSAAHFLDE